MNDVLQVSEAHAALLEAAKGRFGKIPAELVVAHVLRVTAGGDWPVQKAALESIKRRLSFAQRDAIRVVSRPERRELLGVYRVARKGGRGGEHAGYDTALFDLDPLRMSCNCADFVRSSLGLCKHGLVVLAAIAREVAPHARKGRRPQPARRTVLTWSPVHPLDGAADRLERFELLPGARSLALDGFANGRPARATLRSIARRLTFIRGIARALARGKIDAEPAALRVLAEEHDRARELDISSQMFESLARSLRER